jgi:hypothetical protein
MGGIKVNTEILCRNFAEAGHKVTLITNTTCKACKADFLFSVARQTSFILAVISRSKWVTKKSLTMVVTRESTSKQIAVIVTEN